MDILKALSLDHWYKVVMAVSAVILLAALTLPLQFPNAPIALISLGTLLIGTGEWRNHPRQTRVGVGMTITGYPRSASLIGTAFDLLGFALVCWGIYRLVR